MSKLKAGVIGAGVFGGYHAGKYAAHEDTELVAVFDVDLDATSALATKYEATAYNDLDPFLNAVDIITIASPAATHFKMGQACLNAGKPVLIEKPIAANAKDGAALVELAKHKNLVLAVDHQERAVAEAMGLLDIKDPPQRIEAVRYGTWSPRGSDVSVTLDLMTHDLDLVCALMGDAKLIGVETKGSRVKSDNIDDVEAHLTFDGGREAVLRASRIKDERERWMSVSYPSGTLNVDFISREFSNKTPYPLNGEFTSTPQGQDPLGYSVAQFILAVKGEIERPLVTGAEGHRALQIADMIDSNVST